MTIYRTKEGLTNNDIKRKLEYWFDYQPQSIKIKYSKDTLNTVSFCARNNIWNPILEEIISDIKKCSLYEIEVEFLTSLYQFLLREIVEEYNPELEKLDEIIKLLKER